MTESTHSMQILCEDGLQSPICTDCQQASCSFLSANQTTYCCESRCFHCQFFHCSHCSASKPMIPPTIPSLLSTLPCFHFYWFQSKNPTFPSFCVFHFFEQGAPIHPFVSSLLSFQTCSTCSNIKPLVFAYIPSTLCSSESIQWLLAHFPSSYTIQIPYSNQPSPLLK